MSPARAITTIAVRAAQVFVWPFVGMAILLVIFYSSFGRPGCVGFALTLKARNAESKPHVHEKT
jgi:hypothetical protein